MLAYRDYLTSCAVVALLTLCGMESARAAPDQNVNWLLSKPMSLMDWGIVEMGRRLEGSFLGERSSPPSIVAQDRAVYTSDLLKRNLVITRAFARYEWDANRIILQFTAAHSTARPTADDCRFVLKRTRDEILGWYMGDPKTDILKRSERVRSATIFLSETFRHPAGYAEADRPSDLFENLADVVTLRMSLNLHGDDNVFQHVNCTGSLLGDDVSLEIRDAK